MNKPKIEELKNGLTLEILKTKYPWILEADIINAILSEQNDQLFWESGKWIDGTWNDGKWEKVL